MAVTTYADRQVFIATSSGTVDDTSNITAALAVATAAPYYDTFPTVFGSSGTSTTGFTTSSPYSKIQGNGGTLYILQGSGSNGPIITVPGDSASPNPDAFGELSRLILYGRQGKTGAETGFSIGNNGSFVLDHVFATNLLTGFSINAAQFCEAHKIKAVSCGVGIFIRSILVDGGGNSWTFYDPYTLSCSVGMLIYGDNYLPVAPIYLRNINFLDSDCCALASISIGPYKNVVHIDGSTTEDTYGTDTSQIASYTYAGPNGNIVIPSCAFYASNTIMIFNNMNFYENFINPCIIAVNGSTIVLNDTGAFVSSKVLVQCDSTSKVLYQRNSTIAVGAVQNLQ